jgi:hypothetical protein
MDMQGLDIEQVHDLARQFDHKADEIDEVLRQLHLGLRETEWSGPDRHRFEGDFDGTITPDLRTLERSLRDTAERLRLQARSQEQASRW